MGDRPAQTTARPLTFATVQRTIGPASSLMEVSSIEKIVSTLNQAGARYLIAGGLAVNAHGYVRYTKDIDLFIALDPPNVTAALRALMTIGFQPRVPVTPEQFAQPDQREIWRKEKGMVDLQHWSDQHPATPIDVFETEPLPFAEEYARAPQFEIAPDLWAPFVSLEGLIAMKRAAGRPQDLEDVCRLGRL